MAKAERQPEGRAGRAGRGEREARQRAPQPASFPSLAGAAAGQSAQCLLRSCGGCQELSWRSRGLLQLCWAPCCFFLLWQAKGKLLRAASASSAAGGSKLLAAGRCGWALVQMLAKQQAEERPESF